MKVPILGGTRFIGPYIIRHLVDGGVAVNRGNLGERSRL
jgi:hypothetical protein